MTDFARETSTFSHLDDWGLLVIAAFLLLSLGLFMGMFIEKSLKKLLMFQFSSRPAPPTVSAPLLSPVVGDTESGPKQDFDDLLPPIDRKYVPKHVAVIMDGNRRYGKLTQADPLQGHWAGGQTLVDFVQWCMQDGVEIATVYAFSTENWNRDPIEVTTLMTIFAKYAETFVKEALAHGIKVKVFSTDLDKLPPKVRLAVEDLQQKTQHLTKFTLNICLSYGGRREILRACQSLCEEVKNGRLQLSDITEEKFSWALCSEGIPDPDILIRTSGEFRLSNFLLWQIAYTELFFIDKFWPQFTQRDFRKILHEFVRRGRRFGK